MFLPTLVRRLAQASRPEFTMSAGGRPGSKLRTVWPPDFTTMTPQQQLRWEKKYKRRLGVANAQPRLDKAIRLIQLATVAVAVWYCGFVMEWSANDPARDRLFTVFGIFTEEERRKYERKDGPV
ncbi:hypothetical protein C8A05DRAFT_35813 [Staphylotrichum tortipilum]|uniref:Uncharacterized protein n=1 Tax=Staphylotrichum tortipilum TaxID=2831512 RepID=A0AAN6MI35_9PEZI|nr:hypothetical protein C8A05DRAFT_35813 [Staphylotrichum longicolle]